MKESIFLFQKEAFYIGKKKFRLQRKNKKRPKFEAY